MASASAPTVTYEPGSLLAIISPTTIILADIGENLQAAEQLWPFLEVSDSPDLITLIMESPLRSLKSFGLLRMDKAEAVVLLRGEIVCLVKSHADNKVIDANNTTTWLESRIDASGSEITLAQRNAPEPVLQLPMQGGVGLARSVTVVGHASGQHRHGDSPSAGDIPSSSDSAPETLVSSPYAAVEPPSNNPAPTTTEPEAAETALVSLPTSSYDPVDVVELVEQVEAPSGNSDTVLTNSNTDPLDHAPVAKSERADPGDPSGENRYTELLFGSTVRRAIEDAAVRPEEETDLDEPTSLDGGELLEPTSPGNDLDEMEISDTDGSPIPQTGLVATDPSEPTFSAQPIGIIDQLPWKVSASVDQASTPAPGSQELHPSKSDPTVAAPPSPHPTDEAQSDESGFTISKAHLQHIRDQQLTEGTATPLVQAILCPKDHPNPPTAVNCRVCSLMLDAINPITIPRPPLGRLVMSTGETVPLDRPILMGRDPSSDRLVNGETPHLIRISSPDREISRNHAEIQLDGWRPILIDLKSMNGTRITMPAYPPERLRPGNRYPLQPGATINLGDEITIVFVVGEYA